MSDKIKVHVCPDCGLVMDLMSVTRVKDPQSTKQILTKSYRCSECGRLEFEKEKTKR